MRVLKDKGRGLHSFTHDYRSFIQLALIKLRARYQNVIKDSKVIKDMVFDLTEYIRQTGDKVSFSFCKII